MIRALKLIALSTVVMVLNWSYPYQEVHQQAMGNGIPLITEGTGHLPETQMTFAGWPCKFYVRAETDGMASLSSFSWRAALLNAVFWGLLAAVPLLYRKLFVASSAPNASEIAVAETAARASTRRRPLQLSDIFVATGLVAMVFGFWQVMRYRAAADQDLGQRIVSHGGSVRLVAMLPAPATWLLQLSGWNCYLRLRDVHLQQPDDGLLAEVVQLPYLRTLNCAGGNYDFKTLDPLRNNLQFSELSCAGRELDSEGIATIAAFETLQKLNLMRTNITAAGVVALGEQPRLLDLNLVHTDVKLSELTRPVFARSLLKLALPHPAPGQEDALVLEGWPELVELSCYEYDELINRSPVTLTLRDLPKLAKLELDALQLFDLALIGLPSLTAVELSSRQWEQRTSTKQVVPSFPWIRKLQVSDVPQLTQLGIFSADTESMEIDQQSLKFGLCVYNKAASRSGYQVFSGGYFTSSTAGPGYLTADDIPLKIRQKWVDDLGKGDGPVEVDLESVPLQGVKLGGLARNRGILRLKIGKSGVTAQQLNDLKGMEQLEELLVQGSPIDGRTIEALVKSLPNLRRLSCDRSAVQRLRLEHTAHVKSVFAPPDADSQDPLLKLYGYSSRHWSPMDALRIVDAPELTEYFQTEVPMRRIHIEDAPALTGLSFGAELPATAVISGVRDLKFFAAGGRHCNDALLSGVLNCVGLQQLTLAYTTLSPETLNKIARLPELKTLVLTGSQLNEDFFMSFEGLPKLRKLRLDHTNLRGSSLERINEFSTLQHLDLGGLELTPPQVIQLATRLPALRSLGVSGATLSEDAMRALAQLRELRQLDLSGCELPDELLGAFLESPPEQLATLNLNSTKLGERQFARLARALSQVRFELDDTDVEPQLMDVLVNQERVAEMQPDLFGQFAQGSEPLEPLELGEIDPRYFSPARAQALAELQEEQYLELEEGYTNRSGTFGGIAVRPMNRFELIRVGLSLLFGLDWSQGVANEAAGELSEQDSPTY